MNRITEFADSFIPDNLSKKRKAALREELICHLLDKTDHYKDIGYEESDSINKAIEEFGADDGMKSYMLREFEELYSERTIWGILAGIFIWGLNILCYPFDLWVGSADFNREPDTLGTFISLLMISAIVGLILFARIKKYRKMLFFIGLSNASIVGFFLVCFYPQMATYSMWYNMIYLIERFTPFIVYNTIGDSGLGAIFLVGVPVVLALYPIIACVLLKLGKIHNVRNPRKKSIATACICFCVVFVTCMLQDTGLNYYWEYPVFFYPYDVFISEETEDIYNRINIGDTVEQAEAVMDEYAIQSIEKYRGFLDKLGKKQLDKKLEEMNFHEDYKIYFPPYSHIDGQGFVGIRSENGIVTGVAIGNVEADMFNEKTDTFGYSQSGTWKTHDDMELVREYINSLKVGDREEDITSNFGEDFGVLGEDMGMVYALRKYAENGVLKTYYRVYYYGLTNPEKQFDYEKHSPYYLELYFTEGVLQKGALYTRENTENELLPKKIMTIG